MITGLLSQLHRYKNLHPNLASAIDVVLALDLEKSKPGKYGEAGDPFFYMINEYDTKLPEECEPERHRHYTDIQIMISGSEGFGYIAFERQTPSTDFRPDNDVAFFDIDASEMDYVKLTPG